MISVSKRTTLQTAAIALLGLTLPTIASAQTTLGKTYEEILEGAKKEGKLVAWIVAPRGPDTHKALIDAFNKRFGLETKMEWVPNAPVQSNTRAITEVSAGGKVSVDVIGGGAAEEVAAAVKGNLLKPYPWSEILGKALPGLAELEGKVLPNFKGFALPYQTTAYVLAWNPTLLPDDQVPSKWTDLADPKWSGKIALNSFFLTPLDVTSYAMGSDATLDLAKKLLANKPVLEKGTPAVARAIITGVVPLGVTISPIAEGSERKKEPLKYKMFSDYIPVSQVHLYVPENSPNPNTARLFAAWLADEGSKVGDALEPMVRVGDPTSKLGKMISEQVAKGAKVAQSNKIEDLEAGAKLRDAIALLLSGQAK
jgi:iron(III) transport system substrate-binding protein